MAAELAATFEVLDDSTLIEALRAYRWTGRPGWSPRCLWRAYVAAFQLNIPTTAELIRRLQDNPAIREVCGFEAELPSRWTFTRFFARLAKHVPLVERSMAGLTDQLRELLPGFGDHIAVDSTTVGSHSNPDKPVISDPDASWTAKKGTQGRKVWFWGFKLHLAADATYELPLGYTVTTGKRQDTQEFIPALTHAGKAHAWFRPHVLLADAGYDANANYAFAHRLHAVPIIKAKKLRKNFELDDPSYPRHGSRWVQAYARRQSVERVFSRLKGHRSLNTHCRRGIERVRLHVTMSLLALQATALVAALLDRDVAACTRHVA